MQKVGILFALESEARGFKRVLEESRALITRAGAHNVWIVGNAQILVRVSGIGRERCEAAAQYLIEQGVQWLVCAGFATALDDDDMAPGDVVVASRIMFNDIEPREAYNASESLLAAVPPSGTLGYSIRHCDLVTHDAIVRSSDERRRIFRLTGAAALDMESYAAAVICYKRGIPFAAVRVISDTAKKDLPPEIDALSEMRTFYHQALYVLARPHLWRDVYRLARQSNVAAQNLGDVLGVMVLRLV